MRGGRFRLGLNLSCAEGVCPYQVPSRPSVLVKAAELTIAQESGGAGTLEVVVLAEVTLVAAFAVAHTASALALAAAGAGFVLPLPQAGLCVAQRTRGAVTGLATPEGGTGHFRTAWEEAWGLLGSCFADHKTEAPGKQRRV